MSGYSVGMGMNANLRRVDTTFTPASLTSATLVAWYDASDLTSMWANNNGTGAHPTIGGPDFEVLSMTDKAGHGNLLKATAGIGPIFPQFGAAETALPGTGLSFNGLDQFMATAAGLSPSLTGASATWFAAVEPTTPNGGDEWVLGLRDSATPANTMGGLFRSALSSYNVSGFHNQATIVNIDAACVHEYSVDTGIVLSLIGVNKHNTHLLSYVDGTAGTALLDTKADTTNARLCVSSRTVAGEKYWPGFIYEMGVYTGELSANDISTLNAYLLTKWRL